MMGKITNANATKVEKNLMLCLVLWVEVMTYGYLF
jgi:hypothetical protein